MLKVGNRQANMIGNVLARLSADAKSEGSLAHLTNTQGLTAKQMCAMESADEAQQQQLRSSFKVTRESIKALMKKYVGFAMEDEDGETIEGNEEAGVEEGREAMFTQAQLQAGAITAAALENPAEYAQYATKVNVNGAADSDPLSSGAFTSEVIGEQALAQEAFDAANLREFEAFSMVYNVFAARQSPLQELFYPTIAMTPDQNGVQIFTRVQVYFNNARHKNDGSIEGFDRIPLYQAANDPTILLNEITRVYPVYDDTDPDVAANFADPLDVAPTPVTVDGLTFETAPLKVGIEQGLIGLSQASVAGFTGDMGSEDQIANGARIQDIFVKVTNSANQTSIIKYNLRNLGRTAFLEAPEGLDMDVLLNFINKQMPLTGQTKDVHGNPAAALAILRQPQYENHIAHFGINVTANLNLETGLVTVNHATGSLAKYTLRVNADKNAVREQDAAVTTAIRNSITKIELLYWTPDMNRTNYNLRQRGPLCGTLEKHERFIIRLNAPVAAMAPLTETRTTSDFVAPITAVRTRNDNNAITHMFANHEALMAHTTSYDNSLPRPEIKSLGRHVMNPWADHIEINMMDLITSTRSKNVAEDFRYAFGNVFREAVFRGLRKSLYESSLRLQTGVDGAKPTIIVGTNPVLAKHLNVKDTAGWLGDNFPYDVIIESHEDRRLGGYEDNIHEVFVALSIPGAQWSPHTNGHFLYVPELVTTINTVRNGSNQREIIVQSRCEHVNLCPWALRFTLSGVSESFTTKLPIAFTF